MSQSERRRVAITDVGIVSPIGRGLQTFARNLFAGKSGIRRLSDVLGAEYESLPVRVGGAVATAELVLPDGFVMPQAIHRALLFAVDSLGQIQAAVGSEQLQAAALHCGVGTGQVLPELDDLRKRGVQTVLEELEAQLACVGRTPRFQLASVYHAEQGNRLLQQTFGLAGLGGTYIGACSASTQACIAACEDVAAGADFAIGGGHDTMLSVAGLHLMYELGALTEDDHIRPFDVNRDGTLLGEGAAYFAFEELGHARARGATILAEVAGWGSSMDGYHLTRPDPTGDAAVRMVLGAMEYAQIQGSDIDYVNAHGTSTLANDLVEALVIKRALQGHRAYVSSTKAQVGHLIAACGVMGLAACVSAIREQRVPPNPNLHEPDRELDIQLAPREAKPAAIRYALCNAYGFGGQNTCLILRRPDGGTGEV